MEQNQEALRKVLPESSASQLYPIIYQSICDGKQRFENNLVDTAITAYLEVNAEDVGIIYIDDEKAKDPNPEQIIALQLLEIDCRNGLSCIKSSIKDYFYLIIHSEAILKIDPDNIIAKFRLGEGFHGMKDYQKALLYLQDAYKALPNDKLIERVLNKCKEDLEEQKIKGKGQGQQQQQSYQQQFQILMN